jgi:outer membrane cobalamin receptor
LAPVARGDGNGGPASILVTATRTRKRASDVPASARVLDGDSVRAENVVNVDELFRDVSGVDLQASGFPGSAVKLNLRGLTPGYQSKRVLVLVDGRRQNDAFQGNVEFALLPADAIGRIEVVKGPGSALYGSGAMGGTISIVSRRGALTPVTEILAEMGQHGTQRVRAQHGWKPGALDYFVSASHVETDGYTQNSDGTARDWSAQNLAANVGYELGRDAEVRGFVGTYAGKGTDENSERETRRDYQAARTVWRWDRDRAAELRVLVYRNAERTAYDWKYPGEGIYRLRTLAADLQQSLWVTDGHLASLGGELRRESVDIDEVAGPIDEATGLGALFVQDEIYLCDTLQVTCGLRHDYNGDYGGEWSPRAGILWRPVAAVDVFVSAARAHRAPGLSDRFVNVEFSGNRFEGNPDLDPETLTAYELGARLRPAQAVSLELALFYNDLSDSFDFILEPDGVFRARNVTT